MNLELLADRDRALAVTCPLPLGCGEPIGTPCTRDDGEGGRAPLEHLPAHPARLDAAGVLHAPLDPREIRTTTYRKARR